MPKISRNIYIYIKKVKNYINVHFLSLLFPDGRSAECGILKQEAAGGQSVYSPLWAVKGARASRWTSIVIMMDIFTGQSRTERQHKQQGPEPGFMCTHSQYYRCCTGTRIYTNGHLPILNDAQSSYFQVSIKTNGFMTDRQLVFLKTEVSNGSIYT